MQARTLGAGARTVLAQYRRTPPRATCEARLQRPSPLHRALSTSPLAHRQPSSNATQRSTPRRMRDLNDPSRGPASKEDTQTDFGALDVLHATPPPSTSVNMCAFDGFGLDSGLRIYDGNGVILVGGEAFVWRPWMGQTGPGAAVVDGEDLKKATGAASRTGGLINEKGQFSLGDDALGLLASLWPRPDMLIVGTGPSIRPLAPATRAHIQELGMRLEVLDTRNAASQFNLLATERGIQEVAAALVPIGFGR